jgi:hypothetical protein
MAALIRKTVNVEIPVGATFGHVYTWTDLDDAAVTVTGYTAAWTLVNSAGTTVHTATTANGQITLGGAAGTVTVAIPAATTATFTAGHGYRYDLNLTASGGQVTNLAGGHANIRDVEGL